MSDDSGFSETEVNQVVAGAYRGAERVSSADVTRTYAQGRVKVGGVALDLRLCGRARAVWWSNDH